jgi:phytoene dehydrogenase-like protein
MAPNAVDALVIGSGPNGVVAANLLADAGWDVLVLEAQPDPGGAVRTGESAAPGFRHDLFSSFYPLAAGSPVVRALALEDHGLRWRRSDVVVAHPLRDGRCAALCRDVEETAASLERFAPGDGAAWRRVAGLWDSIGGALMDGLTSPFPPVRAGLRLAGRLRARGLLRLARFGVLPTRRFGDEAFAGEGGPLLVAGSALHGDLDPGAAGGTMFGWVLCGLGQQLGFPVPEGGAGGLSGALVARLRAAGGDVRCDAPVEAIAVRGGRAAGVRLAGGEEIGARRAVLAAVPVTTLYEDLLARDAVPPAVLADVRRFQFDSATVKVDWALDAPIPWAHPDARRAGTLHLGEGMGGLTRHTALQAMCLVPDEPYLVMGQYAGFDPTRQPPGCETAWAYTHVPHRVDGDAGPDELAGRWDEREAAAFADRMEAQVEAVAPGFRARIRARHVWTPARLQARNPNLVDGALNGGSPQLHQELVLRPVPGLGRPETPVRGLFLASASAHPGGGVHGACGANAARAALRASPVGWAARRLLRG